MFWNEETKEYWMLLAARVKSASNRDGCVALCTSNDLKKWNISEPLYSPKIHVSAHECPDIFKLGDWWYLVYSSYTDRFGTFYRMSKSLSEPWISPEVDIFDGRAFYADKSGFDGENYYLFGWNPTKTEDLFNWNPQGYDGFDYNTWDWGGNLIVHQLIQRSDGSLTVKCPASIENKFQKLVIQSFVPVLGKWNIDNNNLSVRSVDGFSCSLAGNIPDVCMIEGRLLFGPGTKSLGIVLQADEVVDKGYYIKFEPARDRVTFSSHIMQSEEGGKTFPYEVELERSIKLMPGKNYKIKVFIDGNINIKKCMI